ncbi:MAG: Type 1 glutamine amidotransferase-like domain-containing protein, partial [Pseudomonadota bacterium]
ISAGSICWFEEGVTDSYGDRLEPLKCLGFLKGSNCPHYDEEIERRPSYHSLIASGKIMPGVAADDGVAIHYIGEEIHRIVSSRPNAKAYRVYLDREVREMALKTDYLGASQGIGR